jgi:isopentenyldiphosphate isomerase
MTEILDIVDSQDNVIGRIDRDDPEADKYIFRKVAIMFYTPDKKVFLQRRSDQKKKNPGQYTATVTGHVTSGWSYEETAVKEAHEETGISIDKEKLAFIETALHNGFSMRTVYAYPYDGSIDDLQVEDGEGAGFREIEIPALRLELAQNPDAFTPFMQTDSMSNLLDYIEIL